MANSKRKLVQWNSLWVSSKGLIYRDSHCMCPVKLSYGYKGRTRFNYKHRWYNMARIIATLFLPNPNNYPVVCHKDNNPKNNNVDNLYWGTQAMNIQQACKEDRIPTLFGKGKNNPMYGIPAPNHKLSPVQEQRLIEDLLTKTYTRVQLAHKYGVSRATINNILKRHG